MVSRKSWRWAVPLLFFISAAVAADFVSFFFEKPFTRDSMIVEIKSGQDFKESLDSLEPQAVGRFRLYWLVFAVLSGKERLVKAGEYIFEPGLTRFDALQKLVAGKTRQHKFILPPGGTYAQIIAAMRRESNLKTDDLQATQVASLLPPDKDSPEGLFFPDTYFFESGANSLELLSRAHKKMMSILLREWATRDDNLPLKSPYEALILASIIEKEALFDHERPLIAGVLLRRLERNMRLQADPTVIYGLGDNFDGKLRRSDLHAKTGYNTYLIYGLPPTPIATPGAASIKAALRPDNSDYMYFVSKNDGRHHFSANYEEHSEAVNTYHRKTKEN